MKKIICLLIVIIFLSGCSAKREFISKDLQEIERFNSIIFRDTLLSREKSFLRFFLDYNFIDYSLKNRKGYSLELLKLYNKNPESAIFLADFWHYKVFEEFSEQIDAYFLIGEKEEVFQKINYLTKNFYYNNWNQINKSITNTLDSEDIRYRDFNYLWYLFLIILVFFIIFYKNQKKL